MARERRFVGDLSAFAQPCADTRTFPVAAQFAPAHARGHQGPRARARCVVLHACRLFPQSSSSCFGAPFFFGRLLRILEEMAFSNWQLALLGATAVALSPGLHS